MCTNPYLYPRDSPCRVCGGSGIQYLREEMSEEGMMFRLGVACPACGGKPLNEKGVI